MPLLRGAYALAVLALAGWIIASTSQREIPPVWVAVWAAAALGLLLVPKFPEFALSVYVLMAYGVPYSSDELSLLVDVYFLNAMCSVALAGWYAFGRRLPSAAGYKGWVNGLVVAFGLWVLITYAITLIEGTHWTPSPKHHPTKYYQVLVVFLLASQLLVDRGKAAIFAGAVCMTLVLRALLQGDSSLYLDSYTSQLSVILFPIGLLGFLIARKSMIKFFFGILLLGLAWATLVAQNRAALIGAVAIAVTLVWHWRSKWRLLVLALPIAVFVAAVTLPTAYSNRFRAIWDPTAIHQTANLDRSTVWERIQLWNAGLQMVKDNTWFGVGPGNYPLVVGAYAPGKETLQAHNNFIGIAAETGLPGLALYLAVFISAIFNAGAAAKPDNQSWPRFGGIGVQASLVGYLAIGLFSTRHDLVLAYLLAGWAVALARQQTDEKS